MGSHAAPEVRRAQILEAALACFAKQGFHAAKMDDIVRGSGLSKGAIYWHFKSKDEIFMALLDTFEQEIFAEWDELESGGAIDTLRREGEIALSRLLETREMLGAWTEFVRHASARERFARVYEHTRERLGQTVRRGVENGEIRPCDPDHVAAMITALVEGLLLQAWVEPAFDPLLTWPTACEIMARGLAP